MVRQVGYNQVLSNRRGRRGGLMVSALDSGASAPGSSPGRGHCAVFLGKTLYSHGASIHQGVYMCTGECWGITLRLTSILSRGEQKYSWSLYATETWISSGLMGYLARVQTNHNFSNCTAYGKTAPSINGKLSSITIPRKRIFRASLIASYSRYVPWNTSELIKLNMSTSPLTKFY